jgi:RNA polymerase sigma factor (sigma-70 family)
MNRLRRAAVLPDGGGLSDGQLLASFVRRRDGDAFAALLKRHGRMVMGVCRRVLRNPDDAEDAFQATFLVLARKAGSVTAPNALGGWLYRVAYRTALEARARIARRHTREQQVKDMPEPQVEPEDGWRELLPLLDRELDRLPDKYRVPIVLCELEGKSRREVAGQLHIPEGTLSWRLAHARKLLARRLSRYGAALSAGSVAALLPREAVSACVPASLLNSTARAAVLTAGVVSARVVELTEGVMKAMLLSKIKFVWAVALVAVVGAGAVGLTYRQAAAQVAPSNASSSAARATADELEELRLEVAALRKRLEATRARVKALEEEVQAQRRPRAGTGPAGGNPLPMQPRVNRPQVGQAAPDVFDETPRPRDQQPADSLDRLPRQPEHNEAGHAAADALNRTRRQPDQNAVGRPVRERLDRQLDGNRADPLAQADAALKRLRADPNDKQAAEALERALKQLKHRENLRRTNGQQENAPYPQHNLENQTTRRPQRHSQQQKTPSPGHNDQQENAPYPQQSDKNQTAPKQ